jgi:chromosome partitioning protein
MRALAFIGEKGGSAKTTTVINLAAGLATAGLRVLVVDADSQGNASYVLLGGADVRHPTLAAVLLGEAGATAAIVPTVFDGVDLLPADTTLADSAATLVGEVGRERRLRLALGGVGGYDFLLIDTAATRSVVTTNVLNAVDEVITPVTPSLFALLGLSQVRKDIEAVRTYLENRTLHLGGILLTQVENTTVCRDVEEKLRESFGELVFRAKIPKNVRVEEAHSRHQSVLTFAPKSPGAVAYAAFVEEVLSNGKQQQPKARPDRPRRNPRPDAAA